MQTLAIYTYKPTLQSIAYKLLGSMADAEDAVHDAFVKWLTIDTSNIENAKAYLVSMVTNACMNKINAKKNRHLIQAESLESSLQDHDKEKALTSFDIENQLDEAWCFLHKKLEPIERAVYVLREVFNVEYEDLQFMVDRKAENCRKILSRARAKLEATELPRFSPSFSDIHVLESFKTVCQKGNLSQLIQDFSKEIFHKKKS